MPISSSEFEKSNRESDVLLTEFLRSNYRDAYSVDELVKVMASKGRSLKGKEVERILTSLEYGGKVESRIIGGVTYYRYCKVLGSRPTSEL
jgi:hypothetical protein